MADFSSTQKTVFLDKLGEAAGSFTPAAAKALDQAYTLNNQDNAEIKLRFYKIALKSGPEYAESAAGESHFACRLSLALTRTLEWVVTKGRMKFCRVSVFSGSVGCLKWAWWWARSCSPHNPKLYMSVLVWGRGFVTSSM